MLQSENKDHLSPVEAGAGPDLGNKDIKFFHEVSSKFIRFGLVYIVNPIPFLKGWKSTFPVSLRIYAFCLGYMSIVR